MFPWTVLTTEIYFLMVLEAEIQDQDVSRFAFFEASLLGFQVAAFVLYPFKVFPPWVSVLIISYKDSGYIGPPSYIVISFQLNYLLKALYPNAVTV